MIIATKEFWSHSQFSIVRLTGGMRFQEHNYELMYPDEDLVRDDWVPIYKVLGRAQAFQLVEDGADLEYARTMVKAERKRLKAERVLAKIEKQRKQIEAQKMQKNLFD